jgi:hypothetical protein
VSLDLLAANLGSPVIAFFVLGLVAAAIRSDLAFPEAMTRMIAIYLLVAIGFKGGAQLSATGIGPSVVAAMLAAALLSALIPVGAFTVLRRMGLTGLDAATVAAHYGSASLVTFLAATSFIEAQGVRAEAYLVTLLAVMESPAIIVGLLLARRAGAAAPRAGHGLREGFTNGSVVLLIGATVIGAVSGPRGSDLDGLLVAPFSGVLALFLLDMGTLAGRRLTGATTLTPRLAAFALVMPLVGGALGLLVGAGLGLSVAGLTALATLTASASYIVAPAAFRHAYPDADTPLAVTMALGITFPFNLVLGIPIYWTLAGVLAG